MAAPRSAHGRPMAAPRPPHGRCWLRPRSTLVPKTNRRNQITLERLKRNTGNCARTTQKQPRNHCETTPTQTRCKHRNACRDATRNATQTAHGVHGARTARVLRAHGARMLCHARAA
eukprot:4543286-Lingulodinium_polyedra.AAC.1